MGSFNVSCGISNLSIGWGDKVYFLFLIPSQLNSNNELVLHPETSYSYQDDIYQPLALPIKGSYNDYGALEDIVMDKNTEALEKFFGVPIEDLVKMVTEKRDFESCFGKVYDTFGVNKDIYKKYPVKKKEDFFKSLGFEEVLNTDIKSEHLSHYNIEKPIFYLEKYNVYIQDFVEIDKFLMTKEDKTVTVTCSTYSFIEEFLKGFYELTGIMLNHKEEAQDSIKLINQMTGMFILEDIYEALVDFKNKSDGYLSKDYLNEEMLVEFGFTKLNLPELLKSTQHYQSIWNKNDSPYFVFCGKYGTEIRPKDVDHDSSMRVSVYSCDSFTSNWNKLTKEVLDDNKFKTTSKFDCYYEEFIKKHDLSKNEKVKPLIDILSKLDTELDKEIISKINSLIEAHKDLAECDYNAFGSCFNRNPYFLSIYESIILEDDLKQLKPLFSKFITLYTAMYSCNKFFMPTLGGEQCGNTNASLALIDASKKILIKRKISEQQ